MNVSMTKACTTVAVLVMIGCAFFSTTGFKKVSQYDVEYKMPVEKPAIEVRVKGPAAKLAVILTDPSGQPNIEIIKMDAMISNCQTVTVPMGKLQEGDWVLMVKTFEPEMVVWKKTIKFSAGEVQVVRLLASLYPAYECVDNRYNFDGFFVSFQQTGNLPIEIDLNSSTLNIDGRKCILTDYMIAADSSESGFGLKVVSPLRPKPGDVATIDAKIVCKSGQTKQVLRVKGEFVTPVMQKERTNIQLTQL